MGNSRAAWHRRSRRARPTAAARRKDVQASLDRNRGAGRQYAQPGAGASFSVGPATLSQASLIDCGAGSRTSALGRIRAEDGTQWTVPAPVNFDSARKAADLFNQCGAVRSSGTKALDLETVPLIDAGGDEEFVAYVFADNYFEFYVNGKLLAVDAVPFTPSIPA